MAEKYFLIGEISENFVGRKLPTNGEVMSVFLYQLKIHKLTIKQSANVTLKKVEEIWLQAGLTTCTNHHALQKVLKLFNNWIKLKKNELRKNSSAQKKNEAEFKAGLKKLFDIAQLNLMQKLDDSKKQLLDAQRSDKHHGFIDKNVSNETIDRVTMDIDADDLNPPTVSSTNRLKSGALSRNQSTTATKTTTTGIQQSEMISDHEILFSQQEAPLKTDIMTSELASALDRANISSQDATFILAAAYESIGLDIGTLDLSCSTIDRSRIRFRENTSEHLKDKFEVEKTKNSRWNCKKS